MVTRFLAHTTPELGRTPQRLNEVSPTAILPGDWPDGTCADGRHGLRGPCACPSSAWRDPESWAFNPPDRVSE